MANTPDALNLQQLTKAFRVTTEAVRQWRKGGMPHRMVDGRPMFDLEDCIQWRMDRLRESTREELAPDEAKERARKLRAEADLKELEVGRVRAQLVPVEQYQDRAEAFVGGFGAVAAGQLHRYESDMIRVTTASEARRLTQRIHTALMHGAQEYADTLEAEMAATEPEAAA